MISTNTLNHYIELVAKADENLYIAKSQGRNTAVINSFQSMRKSS